MAAADDQDSVTTALETARRMADLVRVGSSACPACGAQPGQPCRRLDSRDPEKRSVMPRPHAARGRDSA